MRILESFVASPFAGAIGWTLLHSLWEGALISALLATVMLATRSARVRYAAACVAMLAMVAAFAVTIHRLIPESAQDFPRFRTMVPFVPPTVALQVDTGRSWVSLLSLLAPWLAPFWIGGVFLLSLQRVMSCLAVRRLRSRGVCFASEEWHSEIARLAAQLRVSRPVHLLESCFAEIPMVLGHLRPVILVPIGLLANLPSEQVETILLHELAHIRRCDYLVNAFQRIVESVFSITRQYGGFRKSSEPNAKTAATTWLFPSVAMPTNMPSPLRRSNAIAFPAMKPPSRPQEVFS
jgi:beta-lactamase regulating signal transducer with metallopeptidase domain